MSYEWSWILALGLVLKVTLVLGIAGVLALTLTRSSAAARHFIWLMALGGAVAIPLLTPAVPQLRVPVPVASRPADLHSSLGSPAATREVAHWPARGVTSITLPSVAPLDAKPATAPRAGVIVAIIWLFGCIVVIVRCVAAHIGVARVVRAAERLEGEHWQRLLLDAATRTGVHRRVTVMLSDAVGGPITSGLFRPVVLLPADAETWTAERREVVLLHELAHVARMDYAAQLIATAACTAFWFHPVVWIAAARMRLEAEHAADDRVLTTGLPSVRYATHLVELARRAAIGEPAGVAVGIAHRTHIERRISAMLDTTRSRTAISTRLQFVAGAAAMLLLVPLAGIRTEATAAGVVNVYTPEPTPAIAAAVVVASAPVTNVARPATPKPVAVATTVQRADSVFDTTIEAASGGRVVLDLDTGGELVIHGWDEPRVRVRVRLGGPNWRDTRVALGRVSGGVRLSSEFNRELRTMSTNHEFELWIPKQSDIELSSAGGRLSMEDVEGRFRGSTGGGEIDIRRASGRSSLSTGGGNVLVTQSNLSGTVSTGGGSVTLSQVTGGLRGHSGSGPVVYAEQPGQRGRSTTSRDTTADLSGMTITSNRITTGEGRGNITTSSRGVTQNVTQIGPLHISKAGGNITLDAAPEGGTVHTGGGKIVIGRAGGELTVSTGGGDVEIERITGSTRVSTGAGDVNLTIDGDDGRAQIIEATSGNGTIEIVVPRSFDGRVELEAAYTRGFGRRSRIDSDLTLELSETSEWESPNGGTPRKYVRGTAVFGSGRGLIRVGTVNGDVVIRRSNR